MGDSGIGDYRFTVTGYAGLQGEVLRLRNANRPVAQTAAYLDWRYSGPTGAPDPKLFWINDATGRSVGMAALIFRPFWIDGEPQHVAVLGDISLDAALRGKGLGRSLLKFMTEHLDGDHADCLTLVIPNEAARRALTSVGWTTAGSLIPYVFALNPGEKLLGLLKSPAIAKVAAWPISALLKRMIRRHRKAGYALSILDEPNGSFDAFWKRYPKASAILSDRATKTLRWRYQSHPERGFKFAKLVHEDQFAGYLVYKVSQPMRVCTIYDCILLENGDLGCMLALFVAHCADLGGIDTIRLMLNGGHPYGERLWKLGFIARQDSGTFQLYGPKAQARLRESKWFLTYGDKDI
jgi:GNAT superfamily N-acetyltransferase